MMKNLSLGFLKGMRNEVESNLLKKALNILFVLLPSIVVFCICILKDINPTLLSVSDLSVPYLADIFNDEITWFHQIASVVEYGKPLGYWGYNGTHASIGTFGPWGAPIIYLMALPAKLLSFVVRNPQTNIYLICNLLWACFGNLVFVLLAKPNRSQVVRLVFAYSFLYVNHCFIFTAMSETIRFSLGIILAGLVVYMLNGSNRARYRFVLYVVAPCVIVLCMSAYIMFCPVMLIWFYAVYKYNPVFVRKKALYAAISAVIFLASCLAVYYFTGLYTSPYFTDAVTDIINAFCESIPSGLQYLFGFVLKNLQNCGPNFILSAGNVYGGFFQFYLPLYYVVICYLLAISFIRRKKDSVLEQEYRIISALMMILYFAAFVVLYSTSYWVFVRGLNIALTFAVYLMCMTEKPTEIKFVTAVSLLGLYPFLLVANNTFLRGREVTNPEENYRPVFEEYIKISEQNDPWENTVAYYGDDSRECLELPIGVGINFMMNEKPNEKARYVIVWQNDSEDDNARKQKIDQAVKNMEQSHDILYQDKKMILMLNRMS